MNCLASTSTVSISIVSFFPLVFIYRLQAVSSSLHLQNGSSCDCKTLCKTTTEPFHADYRAQCLSIDWCGFAEDGTKGALAHRCYSLQLSVQRVNSWKWKKNGKQTNKKKKQPQYIYIALFIHLLLLVTISVWIQLPLLGFLFFLPGVYDEDSQWIIQVNRLQKLIDRLEQKVTSSQTFYFPQLFFLQLPLFLIPFYHSHYLLFNT